MTTREIVYNANPTAVKFHNSDKFIRCFRGPVGNGKSVACIKELERLAHAQAPNAYGIRKSRAAIIRATYQQLKDTTLNTFKQWFPPPLATVMKINDHKPGVYMYVHILSRTVLLKILLSNTDSALPFIDNCG